MPHQSSQLSPLQYRIHMEFDTAADYIWKAPGLIQHETVLEAKKLREYFPSGGEIADFRWRRESEKLESCFPYLIAVGNLFSATSLFETYLMLIARILDAHFSSLSLCRRQGVSRIREFFSRIGLRESNLTTYQVTKNAITIRNCLFHCSGVLSWSRDSESLRILVRDGKYLSVDDRARRLELGGVFDEVQIVDSFLGERIQVDNSYSHLVCAYFRDHLLQLADAAEALMPAGMKS
jgi:hypothetical protein